MVDRSNDPSAVEEFLALEAAGWKGRQGTALLSRKEDAEFFRAACRGLVASGRLRFLALTGSRTVAMQCNLIANGVIFGFKTCYDEELARHSPGVLLLLEVLASISLTGAVRLDSCAEPGNELVNRLLPDRRPLETLIVGSPDSLGQASATLLRIAQAVRHWSRHVFWAPARIPE